MNRRKEGNKDSGYWLKEENTNLCLKDFKMKNKKGHAALENDGRVEFLCIGLYSEENTGIWKKATDISEMEPEGTVEVGNLKNPTKELEYCEFGLGSMTFPDNQALLNQPYFSIMDTAASTHMTPHDMGVVKWTANERKISMEIKILKRLLRLLTWKG